MNKVNFFKYVFIFLAAIPAAAIEMGVPIQLRLKSPSGVYPTESGLSFKLLVLSPATNCILREEDFSAQTITNGKISLVLGEGVRGVNDPNLTLNQIYNNSLTKNGLFCVDANNNVVSSAQTYVPVATDQKIIRVAATVSSENIIVNFNMRATPYAIQAESVGGKLAADIITNAAGTQMNQTNLNDLLLDVTRFNNLKNIAVSGQATVATQFSGALAGDVTGTQSSTSVDRIKGVLVSAAAPTLGQVLQYNGTQYVPAAIPSAPVTSVAGRTGAVILSSSDISGLGNSAALNVGAVAGTVAAGDDSRIINALSTAATASGDVSGAFSNLTVNSVGAKTSAQIATAVTDVTAATASNLVSTIVKRDASGNTNVGNLSALSASVNNVYYFDGANSVRVRAPVGLAANYILTLPANDGAVNQVLQTDGSGNLAWANMALGFTALNAANNLSDVVSVASARTNLGLAGAAILNVGTAAGTVAAGDDSRINGALQSSAFNGYVASANCTTSQSMYWNSVSSQFLCQAISFPADAVTTVAGRAGAVVLSSSDISGLGNSAVLNVGAVASTVAAGDDSRIVNAVQTSTVFSGDVTGTASTVSVDKIKGRTISSVAPTAGQALIYNGTQWVATSGVPTFAKSTANQTFSAVGVANVTSLSFPVAVAGVYKFRFNIMYTSAATTTGIKLALTFPAATSASALAEMPIAADGVSSLFQGVINSSGDTVIATATPVINTVHFAKVEGIIVPSAAGTVQLQAATEVNASNIIIRAGSFVEVVQVP